MKIEITKRHISIRHWQNMCIHVFIKCTMILWRSFFLANFLSGSWCPHLDWYRESRCRAKCVPIIWDLSLWYSTHVHVYSNALHPENKGCLLASNSKMHATHLQSHNFIQDLWYEFWHGFYVTSFHFSLFYFKTR